MGYFDGDPNNVDPMSGASPEEALGYFKQAKQALYGDDYWNGFWKNASNLDPMSVALGFSGITKGAGAPLGPVRAYHGSLYPDITQFREGTHFGTADAANKRMADLLALHHSSLGPGQLPPGADPKAEIRGSPTVYPVDLHMQKPTPEIGDTGEWHDADLAMELHHHGLIDDKQLAAAQEGEFDPWEWLKSQGYDAVKYKNGFEDAGSTSYIALDPKIIKMIASLGPLGMLPMLSAPPNYQPPQQ